MIKIILCLYVCVLSSISFAQKKNASFQLHIYPTTEAIKIDGIANEDVWQKAEIAKNFFMVLPMDTSLAKVKTEVEMTY
ncbi:MAG TPA: hydrolase, partial [Hanamia sp.]|nr:hydrolase [Hanamia sp.]